MNGGRWRSRLRLADTLAESWLEVTRRPGRALVSGLGVALGTAAIVATLTLVSTVQFQVSDEFDARRATQVEVRAAEDGERGGSGGEEELAFPPDGTVDRVAALSGVEGVAVVREAREKQSVTLNRVIDPTATPAVMPLYGVNADAFAALDLEVSGPAWDRWHEDRGERVIVLSDQAADALGAGHVAAGDQVFIGGLAFTVVGLLEDAARLPGLGNGVLVPVSLAERFAPDVHRDRVLVTVAPGAAGPVAAALPVAISPTAPEDWTAYAPADNDSLRLAVDGQLRTLAVGLGGVVMLLGIVSIGNVTLSSVLQRIHEIGLRRALGARPRHIAAHILLDAATLGGIGGAVGAVLGMTATLLVTAHQGWQPVVDPRIPAVAVAAGIVAGAVAGLYPARVGSRLQPTEALRRE